MKYEWKPLPKVHPKLPDAQIVGAGNWLNQYGRPEMSGDYLVSYWRDRNGFLKWFFTMFATFWSIITGVMLYMMIFFTSKVKINGFHYSSLSEAIDRDPSVYIFLILFPLVGIGKAYSALVMWFNKTKISVDLYNLSVHRGPFPWFGKDLMVRKNSVKQAYVEEYVSHRQNDQPVRAFRVMLQFRENGQAEKFESGMFNYTDARLLERWIEKKLKIEDVEVPGQVKIS